MVSALVGFWRRYPSDEGTTRASNYIDDVIGVTLSFGSDMRTSTRMVFEAASLGLSL